MMTVLGCITEDHNIWLVIVAAIVCVAGAWTTVRLYGRAVAAAGMQRARWHFLTAVAAGSAIWCTHFIAMLAYDPGVPVGFDPVMTIVSLLLAVAGAAGGFAVAASGLTRFAPAVGGGIVGLAVVVMHYTGMMAYRVQGIVSWDMPYLVASVLLSVAFSAAALHVATRRATRWDAPAAAGVLVVAIVSLHFTGMTAFQVEPMLIEGAYSNPAALQALALAVAGVALIILGTGLVSHLIDDHAHLSTLSAALDNMSNGLVMVGRDRAIHLYNDRVLELFDLQPHEMHVGMPLETFLRTVGDHCGWDEARKRRVDENHDKWMALSTTTRIEHVFDEGKILSITCSPMEEGGAILIYDDVTEVREGQKKITHMAFHDALTGLPNRRSFTDHVSELTKQGAVTMLMLDLDRFKAVNDTLGHAVGDKLLVEVAQRLRGICRPADLVFRLGGDELAVIANPGEDEGYKLAKDIVASLSLPFRIQEHTIAVGCSIGMAITPRGSDPQTMQQMADLALYKAKENGRGRVEMYRDGMIEEAAERRRLEADLVRAIEAGQFELHYQPLYDLPDRALTGFEALVRWHHPERGLVAPSDFIPIAEQSGAIVEIGAWVIDEACRQAALWPDSIYVSINVSPVQLRSADILRQLTRALDRHGLTPRRIEVEITETAMVENSEQIAAALAGLRALGVRIAMDDFGTGYSSLAHLREFELDRIKIDRSFINASHTDAGSAAVVRAVTSMARDLAISTTGEGVENEEQLANLVALGCGTAQGYLLGKPLDARAATALLDGGSPGGAEAGDEPRAIAG